MMRNPFQRVFDLSITLGAGHSENSPGVSDLAKHFEVLRFFFYSSPRVQHQARTHSSVVLRKN